jgi:predicted DNA-binding transcriptional regulator AlpA
VESHDENGALTIRQFCDRFAISPASYYKESRAGNMPAVIKVGRHTIIPHAAVREWVTKRLRDAEAA